MTDTDLSPDALPSGWQRYEPGDFLTTPESRAAYLELALQEDDGTGRSIAAALGVIARAHGMTGPAAEARSGRAALHKAPEAGGTPTLKTFLATLTALGLRLSVHPAADR